LVADEAYLFLPWKVWVSGLGKAAGGWTASADRLLWADRVDDDVTFAVGGKRTCGDAACQQKYPAEAVGLNLVMVNKYEPRWRFGWRSQSSLDWAAGPLRDEPKR
jgi:hypothetical protein